MMNGKVKIVLVQVHALDDSLKNLERAEHSLKIARENGADLVVFPEMFMAFPGSGQTFTAVAEEQGGNFVTALMALAATYRVGVVCGVVERATDDPKRVTNAVVVIGPDGELLCRYGKIHLFDALGVRESDYMVAGGTPPALFTINGIRFGLAICYDLRFPELFREQALNGADAVIVPAAWYDGPVKAEQWMTLLRARAIENTVYTVGVNFCGKPFAAHSAAFDPFGVQLADLGEGEGSVAVELDRDRLEEVRTRMPSLGHVRRDLFRFRGDD